MTKTASETSNTTTNRAEKRLKRFRSKPTNPIRDRIKRAITQRLYLVQTSQPTICPENGGPSIAFAVLGSTGNIYEVTISKIPRCNCPDHAKGNLCKHLLFIMLKVVGLEASSNMVYQSAYLTEELNIIMETLQNRIALLGRGVHGAGILANEAVRQHHENTKKGVVNSDNEGSGATGIVPRKKIEGGECPICFDELGSDVTRLTFCQQTCGTNFHRDCMRMWAQQGPQRGDPTCPACRQPWTDTETGGTPQKDAHDTEGYENVGELQGQSRVRDTSSYHAHEWHDTYKRRRRY